MMRNLRDSLHSRIALCLEAKRKADEQRSWRVSKAKDIKELRDRPSELTRRNVTEKKKVEQASIDLRARTASLNLAFVTLKKKQADSLMMHTNAMKAAQMGRIHTLLADGTYLRTSQKAVKRYKTALQVIIDGEKKDGYNGPYDAICGAHLPRGLNPHTVPSDELSTSLGLHVHVYGSGVPTGARDSPRARFAHFLYLGKIIALLVRKILWTESGSGNFGVDFVDSDKKSFFDSKRSNSFNFSDASSHSMERHPHM